MKLIVFIFVTLLLGCASTGDSLEEHKQKEDPYFDSTFNSIKANQKIYLEQQRSKGNF